MTAPPRHATALVLAAVLADDVLGPVLAATAGQPLPTLRSALVALTAVAAARTSGVVPALHSAASLVTLAVLVGSAGPQGRAESVAVLVALGVLLPAGLHAGRRRTEHRHEELERTATLDALTGLVNRRGVRRWLVGVPAGEACTFVLLDVDGLKAHNDAAGLAAGDEVLRRVGASLAAATRPGQCAARWGGDEFVVLSRTPLAVGGADMARRLHAAVAAELGPGGVTVSAAAVPLTTPTRSDAAADLVPPAAEQLVRTAKRAGGDQVLVADHDDTATPGRRDG